jgi:hypothetical protein
MKDGPFRRGTNVAVAGAALVGLALAWMVAPFLDADAADKARKSFPKTVLIIRHAEKPPAGVKSASLSKRGKERASALHELFEPSAKRPHPFPKPDFIFATHNSEKSHRPMKTVAPLAEKFKLTVNDNFYNHKVKLTKAERKRKGKGIDDLAREILGKERYAGKTVLVCWHHGTIPYLARKLGATGAPKTWKKKEAFDRVWQITYHKKGKPTFADLPQQLLPGDAAE